MVQGAQQRDDIQGLRAIAVLAVILFHINSDWLPGGYIGVDVFIVISGYLITRIVLRDRARNKFSLFSFYAARMRRIVPAYLVLLAVTSVVMAVLLIPRDFETFRESLTSALYFNSNNYFANHNDYFAPESHELPLLHTWSLAVEMQFYLLLPAFLILVPRRLLPLSLSLSSVLFLTYSVYQLSNGQSQSVYFSLSARIPEFLIGSLLSLSSFGKNWSQRARNINASAGLMMVVASFFLVNERAPFPGVLALPACIGVALLIAAQKSKLNTALSASPLVIVGALSYSLYLWHWPVLSTFRYFFESYQLAAPALIVAMAMTFLLSYASYHLIEVPFRSKPISFRKIPRYAMLTIMVPVAIGTSSSLNSKLVDHLPPSLSRYAERSEICHTHIVDDCIRGESTSEDVILLIGDSHAAQLNYFSEVVGNSLGIGVRVISSSGCVVIPGFDVERIPDFAQERCRNQMNEAEPYINSSANIILAGKWGRHHESEEFFKSLSAFFNWADGQEVNVLVLSQIPLFDGNIQRILRFKNLGFNPEVRRDPERDVANQKVRNLASGFKHVQFLDLTASELFDNAPFYRGNPIYFDKNHLNEKGSRYYGEVAIPYINSWLEGGQQISLRSK